ncbi:MAG: hypothetical protein IJV16_04170 [Lachnospiraceae bacterium]|nr:hypothetical protein [Lachnospiraceae bacterium]
MGLISKIKDLFSGIGRDPYEYEDNYDEDHDYFDDGYMTEDIPEVEDLDRSEVDMSSRHLRQRYIKNLCDLMAECTTEIDSASKEYRYVTDYLKDCELIEQIPEEAGNQLISAAHNVVHLTKKTQSYSRKAGKLSDTLYYQMEAISEDMPKALNDLREHEDFKEIVRDDLRKLEGEKVSRQFARSEARVREISCRNIAIITVFAMGFVMLILLLMQFMFDMNVIPGFIMAAALGSITLAVSFSAFINARSIERRTTNQINQIIAKQNTVKIKFVNIQNLITYEYEKYHINSSDELAYNWKLYQEERDERMLIRRMSSELDAAEERYRKELVNANVNYPMLWLHQADAVVDRREMVELRHELVARRQGLRKRISYNSENREQAKKEVQDLVAKYPNYAHEILDIVASYE